MAVFEDFETDLRSLAAEVREHLAWETEMGELGLLPPQGRLDAPPAPHVPESGEVRQADTDGPAGTSTNGPHGGTEPADRGSRLSVLATEASVCTRCSLHRGRTKSVFARGSSNSEVVFVGEGPGFHEDQQGQPFVGPAGQLLDRMIQAMGYARDDVYICNVVKCRPPENRTPLPNEVEACRSFLDEQLDVVVPRVVVALGRCAAEALLGAERGKGWRGTWGVYRGFDVMPTYHPAFLLRSPEFKRPVWEDLQKVMTKLKTRIRSEG